MDDLYILKGTIPVVCRDILEWGEWFKTADRNVARTTINQYLISTVFLGVDHNFYGGDPLLFETMVFKIAPPNDPQNDIAMDEYTRRYSTWIDAEIGHGEVVKQIRRLSLVVIEGAVQ